MGVLMLEKFGTRSVRTRIGGEEIRFNSMTGQVLQKKNGEWEFADGRKVPAVLRSRMQDMGLIYVFKESSSSTWRFAYVDNVLWTFDLGAGTVFKSNKREWLSPKETDIPAILRKRMKAMSIVPKVQCPECAGRGLGNQLVNCPECDGFGRFRCSYTNPIKGIFGQVTTAQVCEGGRLIRGEPGLGRVDDGACPVCNGNGDTSCFRCRGRGEVRVCKKCLGSGTAP